jgi:hypothetical protein
VGRFLVRSGSARNAVDETGRLSIPAGSAAILSWEGAEPDVQMGDGSSPRLLGSSEGWIVGSALTSQSLGIVGDVKVRLLDRRGEVAAWDRYERACARVPRTLLPPRASRSSAPRSDSAPMRSSIRT